MLKLMGIVLIVVLWLWMGYEIYDTSITEDEENLKK